MEAASIGRKRPPRRRRRSWAWLALLLYLGFAATAVLLVGRGLDDGLPSLGGSAEEGATGTLSGSPDELALRTIGSRAQRSTLGVGGGTGFVAWRTPGLTIVLSSRPAGGWNLTDGREIAVSYDGRTWTGTLARADPATGLGLVRLAGAAKVGGALWGDPGRPAVRNGQLVAVVGRRSARTVEIAQAGRRRLYPASGGLGALAGAPVLDAQSQLVGVVDSGGGIVPIARACGVIRRC